MWDIDIHPIADMKKRTPAIVTHTHFCLASPTHVMDICHAMETCSIKHNKHTIYFSIIKCLVVEMNVKKLPYMKNKIRQKKLLEEY